MDLGSEIREPEKPGSGSRIQTQASDPGSGSATMSLTTEKLQCMMLIKEAKLTKKLPITPKGINFLNLYDLKNQQADNPVGFYTRYRNLVLTCLKNQGDSVKWKNNMVLTEDEELSPTFEDMILGSFLSLVDRRLPGHVRDHYGHLLGDDESIMDYKADILNKVPAFLIEIETSIPAKSKNGGDQLGRYLSFV
jgi:hypothetical protein